MEDQPAGMKRRESLEPAIVPSSRPGQKGGKRDRNRRLKTRQISDAALRLFLEHGLDSVTIDAITSESAVSKGSFYRYFDSKGHLVETLFAPVREQMSAALNAARQRLGAATSEAGQVQAYDELGKAFTRIFVQFAPEIRLYLQESRGPSTEDRETLTTLRRDLVDVMQSLTVLAQGFGTTRDDIDARLIALSVVGTLECVLIEQAHRGRALDTLVRDVTTLLVRGNAGNSDVD